MNRTHEPMKVLASLVVEWETVVEHIHEQRLAATDATP